MSIRIFTHPVSQPARAVSWACLYEGTVVDEVIIMPGKDTATKEWRATHPIASVPRLEEHGFVLNESHAIMCYLGDKFGWSLYPKDPITRARVHEYMNWHHQNTRRISHSMFAPGVRSDLKIPDAVIAANRVSADGSLNTIEGFLSKDKWLCGEAPTVADLSCYCEVGQGLPQFAGLFEIHGVNLTAYPKISAWLQACEQLRGFDKSHEVLRSVGPKLQQLIKKRAVQSKL
eukprot:CAMPEP_0194482836 /NCGR_PEP_ID=MMETSP0253-20130528/4599_1 /TAXON_ID=2966 /ORGANISM="Noctiluca scintillans" /LENGTH=230 /DNA_ID=CAMNT_0039322397 /DNA_START=50 /DNA_END=742 /DNA_ORIENTATION=+